MIILPDKKSDRVAFLNQLRNASEQESIPLRVRWSVNHLWMQGVRKMYRDYSTGSVTAVWGDVRDPQDPYPIVRLEDLVAKFQAELGRLMRMDTRPAVERRRFGLDSIRKAASGRAIMEYLTSSVDQDRLKFSAFYHCMMFGMCGIGAWTRSHDIPSEDATAGPSQRSNLLMEVIPPWELFPIPYRPSVPEEVDGILRKRWVPLKWVKTLAGLKIPTDESVLQVKSSPFGTRPDNANPIGMATAGVDLSDANGRGGTVTQGAPANTDYVLLEEYFILQEDKDRLGRWIVKIGDHIAADTEYKDRSVYCPIGISRYHPLGGFYGRSFVEILQPLNQEQEELAASLFDNVKKMDLYGTVLIPNSWGVSKDELLQHRRRDRVVFYEPDYAVPEAKTQVISALNTNDFPGKVLSMANGLMDRLTQQTELMRGEAPGRVDSASGLSFLNEMSAIPLSVPANSIASGFTQAYRAILAAAPELLSGKSNLPVLGLDDNLIGLEVDGASGTVKLASANFPDPTEVELGIRDKLPTPPTVKEQKLMALLQAQIITPVMFRFQVWKDNLDLPVGNWAEQENFRKATLHVLTLFGDGQTPGQVMASSEADNPEIHLMVLEAFMAKTEFQFASVEVRSAFEQLKSIFQRMLGRGFPQQLPMPADAAMQAQQMQQMQGGPPAPGARPPSTGLPATKSKSAGTGKPGVPAPGPTR